MVIYTNRIMSSANLQLCGLRQETSLFLVSGASRHKQTFGPTQWLVFRVVGGIKQNHACGMYSTVLGGPTIFPGSSDSISPWVRKIWRRKWQPTPVFLPGKSHGWRNLVRLQSMGSQRVGHSLTRRLLDGSSSMIIVVWKPDVGEDADSLKGQI